MRRPILQKPPLDRRRAAAALLALAIVIVALRLLAAANPEIVEFGYARSIYPRIAAVLTAVTGSVPFSIAEIVVLVLIVAGLIAAARAARRILRAPAILRAMGDSVMRTAIGVAIAYLVFLLLWGFNYDRSPLAASVGLAVGAPQPGELAAVCAELIEESEKLRADVREDGSGVTMVRGGVAGALTRASLGYDGLDDQWPVVAGETVPAKRVLLSPVLALLGISGIFMPFTGEASVNVTLPEWALPFVAAHEIAHQRGFAREDEANFLAYASCARHPDPAARYSAALEGSLYALAALRAVDPGAHQALQSKRGAGVRRDLEALEAWRRRYESRAGAVQEKVNDAYLRAQGQEGVSSYGRMVDLLLAERRQSH
jgi:multidrug transporter EmrE-like cation transporter